MDKTAQLQQMISTAKRIVFFGGAGVSTASGIPDFRSGDGLYAKAFEGLTAEMMLSQSFFYLHPDTVSDSRRVSLPEALLIKCTTIKVSPVVSC